jgi:hypothetical protein
MTSASDRVLLENLSVARSHGPADGGLQLYEHLIHASPLDSPVNAMRRSAFSFGAPRTIR